MAHALFPQCGAQGWTFNGPEALHPTSPSCPATPPAPKQVTDSQTPGTTSHQGQTAKCGEQLVALEGQQAHFTSPRAAATAVADPAHGQHSGVPTNSLPECSAGQRAVAARDTFVFRLSQASPPLLG